MTRVREVGVAGALDPRVIPLLPPADVPAPETLPVATFREGISEIVLASAGEAVDVHSVSDVMIPTDDGAIPARVYEAEADDSAPTLVYFHGGGWVVPGTEVQFQQAGGRAETPREWGGGRAWFFKFRG